MRLFSYSKLPMGKDKGSSTHQLEESRGKKRRSLDGEGEATRDGRDSISKKRKHESSHKSSKRSSKDKRSREKDSGKSRKHGVSSKSKFQEISSADYFAKNNEFSTWLKEEKNVFFSDLSSETARDMFSGFVDEWNEHKLERRYYKGIATGPRTSHKWNIKS